MTKINKIVCDSHSIATDIVIFTVIEDDLKVLLIERAIEPKDIWALPGGFVKENEELEEAAKRELLEETGVKINEVYMEQLYTFGNPKRDSRFRVISVAYFALLNHTSVKLKAGSDAKNTKWFSVKKLPKLAFDHNKIIEYARKRLVWKIEYTNVVYSLLPTKFTLTQLQKYYEAIISKELDKRNFRRKFLKTNLIKATEAKEEGAHRPATLYRFVSKKPELISNPFGQFLKR